jgi:hypothetical protein
VFARSARHRARSIGAGQARSKEARKSQVSQSVYRRIALAMFVHHGEA